ncbi:MAG: hypothetical protein JF571_03480 [Asticcacaulis sp.]|nr:hypothetical protein [Asticcacaulis sp.]
MNTPYLPNEQYFLVRWSDLETAWRMLAAPDKQAQIEDTLQTLQTLDKNAGSEKAIFTMVAATAWLTDVGVDSSDG